MALVLKDRVQETTTTAGTGTLTLAGAVAGFQSFAVIGDGNTTYYSISGGSEWELGIGTYTASGTTLSRDVVLSSSNSGSLVPFSAGTKIVFCTYPTERVVIADGSSIFAANSAILPVSAGGTGSSTATFSGENITSLNASAISSGTLGVARGGTGAATLDANSVILGNGTSAVQFVAPGTSSNVLTSNGTTWVSQAAGGGAQDFDLIKDYSFTGQTYSQFDVTDISTTAGYYCMTGRIFVSADGETASIRLRMSINNGSSFYSAASNYARNGSGQSGLNLAADLNRSLSTNPAIITFTYFYYQPSAANNSDLFTMNGTCTMTFINSGGGFGSNTLTMGGVLTATTSPVNAFRFDRSTGLATYTSGYIKFYRLAMS